MMRKVALVLASLAIFATARAEEKAVKPKPAVAAAPEDAEPKKAPAPMLKVRSVLVSLWAVWCVCDGWSLRSTTGCPPAFELRD